MPKSVPPIISKPLKEVAAEIPSSMQKPDPVAAISPMPVKEDRSKCRLRR